MATIGAPQILVERTSTMTETHLLPSDNPTPDEQNNTATSSAEGSMVAKIILCAVAAIVALVSILALPGIIATPEFWSTTAHSIDNECETVMKLIGAAAGAATLVAAVPGDATTPVANSLADLGGNLAVVLAALYLEKYLLVVLSKAALMFLIPLGCASAIIATVAPQGARLKEDTRSLAGKFWAFALAAILVVPASVLVSDTVREAYTEFGNSDYIEQALEAGDASAAENADVANSNDSLLDSLRNKIADTISQSSDWASAKLTHLIEAFAVMVVTSCVIPILVLLFFLWLINTLLGLDIRPPALPKASKTIGRLRK